MGLLSHYKVITVTHHNLQLNEIANFYIQRSDSEDLSSSLSKLKLLFNFEECIYLETCNRVSYIVYTEELIDNAFLKRFFHFINPDLDRTTLDNIAKYASCYNGESAINHVFELASSMDSLVVGEREIFRQFRAAYDFAKAEGHAKDNLRILEKAAVKTAKEVYHSTAIGEKALSIVSLAIQALKERELPTSSRILLVGSGETNTLVAKFLKKYGFGSTAIYNRSLDNAKELSSFLNANAYHISELTEVNSEFDVIFICTAANKVIIDFDTYKQMIGQDSERKLIIDLAVPRNVSEDLVDHFNVDYVDIESLRHKSEENLKFRKKELDKARPIIQRNISSFISIFHQRNMERTLAHIPSEIKNIKTRAIESVYKNRIDQLDPTSKELLLEMMDYMEKKCVSVPMRVTREGVKTDLHN